MTARRASIDFSRNATVLVEYTSATTIYVHDLEQITSCWIDARHRVVFVVPRDERRGCKVSTRKRMTSSSGSSSGHGNHAFAILELPSSCSRCCALLLFPTSNYSPPEQLLLIAPQTRSLTKMSFLARTTLRTVRVAPVARFSTTAVANKSVVDSAKDTLKKVDRTVSDAAISGIETGGK